MVEMLLSFINVGLFAVNVVVVAISLLLINHNLHGSRIQRRVIIIYRKFRFVVE